MSDDHGLVDTEMADPDEWEEIHVEDSEADRIAKSHDRDFEEFAIRLKDTEQFKVEGAVFDDATLAALYKLVQDGYIDAFGGPISTGKEANVYLADGPDGEIAVKVYLINTSNFRQMRDYLEGDPRFEGIGNQKRQVVMAWVKKEFANLRRAKEAGVRVPNPIAVERNVLVMEYLGQGDDRARRLGEVHIENPETAFEVVREYMRRLYDSGLVHGDLSEYNIVVHEGELTIIDLGQAVTVHHPNSRDFLERDCRNIANFFARQGVDTDGTSLLAHVTEQER
ncbi:serine/threonine-protein kinase Rio1 [Haladaptatus sp. DYSN1]|uniref:serine/threonine-protein kinase Rio1 n=1 Tax=unclassified Haladaptatus TaxID=2622732 RepID=UPI00240595F7|nr:serine/threonine-protein kinase Rio1 [Haladaptatus sp. DYSN1]